MGAGRLPRFLRSGRLDRGDGMTNTRGKGVGNGAEDRNAAGNADVMVTARKRGGTKLKKAPEQSWSQARRQRFLDALAATANVRMAADAAGMGLPGAYKARQRDTAFAELWEAALEQGYGRLESELLSSALGERRDGEGHVIADVNAIEPNGDRAVVGRLDQTLALHLLALRRPSAIAGRAAQKRTYKAVPIGDVEQALMKQLAIAEQRLRRVAQLAGAGLGEAGGADSPAGGTGATGGDVDGQEDATGDAA